MPARQKFRFWNALAERKPLIGKSLVSTSSTEVAEERYRSVDLSGFLSMLNILCWIWLGPNTSSKL